MATKSQIQKRLEEKIEELEAQIKTDEDKALHLEAEAALCRARNKARVTLLIDLSEVLNPPKENVPEDAPGSPKDAIEAVEGETLEEFANGFEEVQSGEKITPDPGTDPFPPEEEVELNVVDVQPGEEGPTFD